MGFKQRRNCARMGGYGTAVTEANAHAGLVQLGDGADLYRCVVEGCSAPAFGRVEFIGHRIVDDSKDRRVSENKSERDAPERDAAEEVCGAVYGIDDQVVTAGSPRSSPRKASPGNIR
jgi:hypothetical protein